MQQQVGQFEEDQGTVIRNYRREHERQRQMGGGEGTQVPRRGRERPATRADVMRLLRTAQEQRASGRRPTHDVVIPPITTSGVVPIPIPVPAAAKGKDGGAKIIQKVTVQQGVQTKKKKKRVSALAAKRKEYNALKKALLAEFRKAKRDTYKSAKDKLKQVPSKERAAARKRLKQELQTKLAELKKQLPAASKLKQAALDKLISLAKRLKW